MRALIAARKRRDVLIAQADALNAIAAERDWEDNERAEYDAIMAKVEVANGDIRRIEASATLERTGTATGASYSGDGTPLQTTTGNITQVHDNASDKPWASMGEQLMAIVRAAHPDNPVRDPRLMAAATGASVGDPSAGGYLMQTSYSDALLAKAREESPILGMCQTIPIPPGADSIELPYIDETSRATGSRWGGVQVYRTAEADTVTATRPKIGKLKIDTSQIMGIAYATNRLLQNASTVETVFGNAFASEFAFKVTDEIIRGAGGSEMLGLLSATGVTVSQAKDTGQAAATISVKNLSNMWSHVPARSKSRGVWLINNDVEPELDLLSIPAGTGALEPRFVTYDQTGAMRIKGRPVMQLEQCATLGTVGDIIFADFGEYIVSPQGGITGESSMHVRFLYDEMTFRWSYYINGRPAWASSITPYKGSTALSPFVTLATRS